MRLPFSVCVCMPVLLIGGCADEKTAEEDSPEVRHQQAMNRWCEHVANKFKGDQNEVMKAFKECFRKGELAEKYDQIFKTAESTYRDRPGEVQFNWTWDMGNGGGEGDGQFQVYVGGSPPVIEIAWLAPIWH